MTQLTAIKRPAEAVRAYLQSQFLNNNETEPVRLPTINEFAKHLKISASTVRTVLKELADEGRLEMVRGRGTFLIPGKAPAKPSATNNCLGINIPVTLIEGWPGTIFLGAATQALKEGLTLTALGAAHSSLGNSKEALAALSRIDAMIALPEHGHPHETDRICAEKGIPVVHVNSSGFQATANFVSNDYFAFCYNLALAWCESGRKSFGLVCATSVNESVSAAQTYAAFSVAAASYPDVRLHLLGNTQCEPTQKAGYDLTRQFLTKHGPESLDAVYGFGDYLAQGAAQALLDAGRKIPDDASVVGGTGIKPIHLACGTLVTMRQPMKDIGKSAVSMAITRIHNKGTDVPGQYIMPALGEGTTIRPQEREAFQRLLTKDKELL